MKTFSTILITAVLAVAGSWFAFTQFSGSSASGASGEKLLYYQSAMHPWIKSEQPGQCAICGMDLTPVYEGEEGFDGVAEGNVTTLTHHQLEVLNPRTSVAKTRPLARTLRVAGVIDENATRHRVLAAYVDGRIDKLHVNYVGAEVSEGTPLIDFYSPTLLQAEREYRQLSGDLKKNTGLRLRQMGLTSAQIAALDGKSSEELNSQILAPISGTVVSQSVFEGEYVEKGQALFEIADFSSMWYVFRVYEQDLTWIKPGLTVHVSTPSLPGKVFSGKIAFIDPNLDRATRSTKVRVELENPLVDGRRELLSQVYADGIVEFEAPEVLTIPRSAVIQAGPDAVAYIDLGEGAFEQASLQLGKHGDELVEVLSGLSEGDVVVTTGNLLIDGQTEMNRSAMGTPEEEPVMASDLVLNGEQKAAIGEFLIVANAMAETLADDDLAAFNEVSEPAMDVTGAMIKALGEEVENLDALDQVRHFHGFDDIYEARVAYHKFSVAATAALEPLRQAGQTPAYQVFECGMVDEAILDVPKKGRWIQTGARSLANPFFGDEMLRCGVEIKVKVAPVEQPEAEKSADLVLNDEQKAAIGEFLIVANAMAETLADDDLAAFNEASEPAMDVTGAMIKALGKDLEKMDELDQARHFHGFDDIYEARVAYHKFSVTATAALEPLREAGQTPEFQVFECGMVDEAIPDVPKKGRWIQTGARRLANPFFGDEMLRCGKEIKL